MSVVAELADEACDQDEGGAGSVHLLHGGVKQGVVVDDGEEVRVDLQRGDAHSAQGGDYAGVDGVRVLVLVMTVVPAAKCRGG